MSEVQKIDYKDSKYATGRRKTSIAKVWLKKGSGQILINGKKYEDYFTREIHKMKLLRPFEIINQTADYGWVIYTYLILFAVFYNVYRISKPFS